MIQIGFGGGCHWCTEAVFQSLRGTREVQQGFIKSAPPHDLFSEAVLVTFDPETISAGILVDVHLRTHASTSQHKMRGKYRSAVYVFSDHQEAEIRDQLSRAQGEFDAAIITQTLRIIAFKNSAEQFQNYYRTDAERPFCKTYIDPKLAKIRKHFAQHYDPHPPGKSDASRTGNSDVVR